MLNLRKSLAGQYATSTGPPPKPNNVPEAGLRKLTLEERLRASVANGSARSPSPPPNAPKRAISPPSVPLPESPVLSPATSVDPLSNALSVTSRPSTPRSSTFQVQTTGKIESRRSSVSTPPSVVAAQPEEQLYVELPTSQPPPTEELAAPIDTQSLDLSTAVAQIEESALIVDTPAQDQIVSVDSPIPEAVSQPSSSDPESDLEGLQQRLKLVEQQFVDVSNSFRGLQAERRFAETLVRQLSSLKDAEEVKVLRHYLQDLISKAEVESSDDNESPAVAEELVKDSQGLSSELAPTTIRVVQADKEVQKDAGPPKPTVDEEAIKNQEEICRLQKEVEKYKTSAAEEEEKRVKALSLLKAVRQKLLKAEKDKEDTSKELTSAKEKERKQKEQDDAEHAKLQNEVYAVKVERDNTIAALRAQFDRDLADTRARLEKDLSNAKEKFSLDMNNTRDTHSKELAAKNSKLAALEASVNNFASEKNSLFEQLMIRQAELESSQCHAESLQSQHTELEFQLRECQNSISLLNEEIMDVRGDQSIRNQASLASSEELVQSLATAEAKYETKISHLKTSLEAVEKERNENEAQWSRKLREKIHEAEELTRILQSSASTREKEVKTIEEVKADVSRLQSDLETQRKQNSALQQHIDNLTSTEALANRNLTEVETQKDLSEKQLEEAKAREVQLVNHNKTLREELHKVQASVSLLERRRSPGVGYWSPRDKNPPEGRTSISVAGSAGRVASPDPVSSPPKSDEDVNFEYLRNVIMQFLEHKEMRPNLVRVLSVILHFTPQETRRLVAKV